MKHLLDINEFLNESKQAGILYHFTPLRGLRGIVSYNEMRSGYNYISFTRSFNLELWTSQHGAYCRIAVDGEKLSHKYKIQPYLYDPTEDKLIPSDAQVDIDKRREWYGKEREERVKTSPLLNIKSYVVQVDILKWVLKSADKELVSKLMIDNPDVEFNFVDSFAPVKFAQVLA